MAEKCAKKAPNAGLAKLAALTRHHREVFVQMAPFSAVGAA